jgi:hypothetical protein
MPLIHQWYVGLGARAFAETSHQIKKKLTSYIRLKLAAQQRPRHPIELVIPDGSVIDRIPQRVLVLDQRLTVKPRV